MRKPVPPSITREGLLGKSKLYIGRAFRAYAADDLDEYQLWASLALELVGKAALANIHPSLVVDPNHADSMFAASGISIGTDVKTIQASTLYARLGHLSKYFDSKVKEFCDAISLRRNAELHSGEAPFVQMKIDAWEGRYWHAAQIVLGMIDLTLDEWLGADRAKAPKAIVKEARRAAVEAAKIRVEQAKEHFGRRTSKERKAAIAESEQKKWYHYRDLFRSSVDHEWEVTCPACAGKAFLGGLSYDEEVLESSGSEENVWEEEVSKSYGAEEFRCPVCDLHLDSREEIEVAGLDPDLVEVEIRERQYEPEYGNC